MKILLVCNYYQPQFAYGESEVGKNLLQLGHKVEIITGNKYFPFPNYKQTAGQILGKRKLAIGRKKEIGIWVERKKIIVEFFARSLFLGIFTKIKNYKPDLVIVFGLSTPSSIQVALFKKIFTNEQNFKFIGVDSHLSSEFFLGNIFLKKIFYSFFRLFFSKLIDDQIDKIIAVQEDTKKIIREFYGLRKPIVLVSHGTNLDLFKFSNDFRHKIRQEYKLKENDFVIIYTGKIIASKGIDILIKAWQSLLNKYNNIYLLIIGDGPEDYKKICFSLISLNDRKKIIKTGFLKQENLFKYYSAADLAVWPLQESLAMNDAAACSLPFIANHELGARQRIGNKNALLYKLGDFNDLAKKIELLYKNKKERLAMGKRGRNLMEEKFSWKKVAERYL